MKCRACWADKAFVRQVRGWRALLQKCFVLTPLKCVYCYHQFSVFSILTYGKQLTPPPPRRRGTGRSPQEVRVGRCQARTLPS